MPCKARLCVACVAAVGVAVAVAAVRSADATVPGRNGKIAFESKEGEGSTFVVTLPLFGFSCGVAMA